MHAMRSHESLARVWQLLAVALFAALSLGAARASFAAQAKRPGAKAAPVLKPFEGSYEEAMTRAVERNVPLVLVAIAEEHDKDLDTDIREFRDSLFSEPAIAATSELAVVILACNGVHPAKAFEVTEGESKTTRQLCSVYRTTTCQTHQKQFDRVYAEHNVEGELRSPSVFLLGVDRKVARAWNTGNSPGWQEIAAAQSELQKKLGEGLSELQFGEVTALLPQARAAIERKQWGEAFGLWGKVLVITQATKYAAEAREGQTKAAAELETLRAAARVGLDEGRAVESYKALLELQREWAGTSFEKELARDVAAAEKHKLGKDAIAAYKRELEAERLWSEAQELLSANNQRAAQVKLRAILRKYAGTPAEKRVREQFAQIAADEDSKKSGGGG